MGFNCAGRFWGIRWWLLLAGALLILCLTGIYGMKKALWNGSEIPLLENMQQPSSFDMVELDQYIPGITVELRYACSDNVFGKAVYESEQATLRRGTASKLKGAEDEFEKSGFHLKIWDAYRAPKVQFLLWEIMPESRFVVDPHKSFSYHSRGVAVDVTLVDGSGKELPMPSGFDEFGPRANRDYSDVDKSSAQNAAFLEEVMRRHGFNSIFNEWWHFADKQAESYPVIGEANSSPKPK